MTDLDAALAAEEHRQGMRYGEDPSHCGDCRDVAPELRIGGYSFPIRVDESMSTGEWTLQGPCGCASQFSERQGVVTYTCDEHGGDAP